MGIASLQLAWISSEPDEEERNDHEGEDGMVAAVAGMTSGSNYLTIRAIHTIP